MDPRIHVGARPQHERLHHVREDGRGQDQVDRGFQGGPGQRSTPTEDQLTTRG